MRMRFEAVLRVVACLAAAAQAFQVPATSTAPALRVHRPRRLAPLGSIAIPSFVSQSLLAPAHRPALRTVVARSAAACAALIAVRRQRDGPATNPERAAAVPIRCPWPFVLVAVPWTRLGRRSLRAGFFDYQTWVCIALLLLRL